MICLSVHFKCRVCDTRSSSVKCLQGIDSAVDTVEVEWPFWEKVRWGGVGWKCGGGVGKWLVGFES